MKTERLYYRDSYLREFRARILETADAGRRVYLDRTAFYPTSGGQPYDTGTLSRIAVREVIDEDDRVAHILDAPLAGAAGTEIEGVLDWARRWDHMQQHTGQHLLSAVSEELYGFATVSFHLGAELSTIDLNTASLAPEQVERVEERCAEVVAQALPVNVAFENAADAQQLRKPSERSGTLRIISIEGLDRSACGGTHLRSTAEIGPLSIRKLDKIRGNVRLEFVCGQRALRRARADYRLLSAIGRTFAVPVDETPALASSLVETNKNLEKSLTRLATELARREGAELYQTTVPGADGIRRVTQHGAIDDSVRARAQAFVGREKAVFLVVCDAPPSILLATSPDSGVHAGNRVKTAVTAVGGRGGGNQALAQGSVPSPDLLPAVLRELL